MTTAELPSMVEVVCAHCGVAFTKPRWLFARNENAGKPHYCTRACSNRATAATTGDVLRGRGEGKGYVIRNGRAEHRLVAEQAISRALLPGEVVHHIDGNKRNNAPENLRVLSSHAEHNRLHRAQGDVPPGHERLPSPITETACATCGELFELSRGQRTDARAGRTDFYCTVACSNKRPTERHRPSQRIASPVDSASCARCGTDFALTSHQRVTARRGQTRFYCTITCYLSRSSR